MAARLHFAAFVHVMTEKGREAFTIVVATRATLQPAGLPREEKEEGASLNKSPFGWGTGLELIGTIDGKQRNHGFSIE